MKKILISACLLGQPVRYDGKRKAIVDDRIQLWLKQGRLIAVCPEVAGGLTIPRAPAEIQSNGQIITEQNKDVTLAFQNGALAALQLAKQHQCNLALLKANSPSCGSGKTYDGSFSQHLIERDGISAKLLKENGIQVFSEFQLDELAQCLCI